jgi:hypothetical protein
VKGRVVRWKRFTFSSELSLFFFTSSSRLAAISSLRVASLLRSALTCVESLPAYLHHFSRWSGSSEKIPTR